jgi:AraC-like DNA-binding protein
MRGVSIAKRRTKTVADSLPAAAATEPPFFSHQITEARRFFLEMQPAKGGELAVVCGGSERCAGDYRVVRRDFPYCAVEFVARGVGTLRLGEKEVPLTAGMIFGYGPGIFHEMRSSAGRPLEKYFLTFTGAGAMRRLRECVLERGAVLQSSAPEDVLQIFNDLIDAGRRETAFRARICRAMLEHLLWRIAETALPVGTVGTEAFETYQRCRRWMEKHYVEGEHLGEMAGACGVDPAYLCRLFKRFAHQSPWQFVLRLKMRDAAQRLQSEHVLVREVAAEFGFGDAFEFSRTFRRVMGISPREFVRVQRRGA